MDEEDIWDEQDRVEDDDIDLDADRNERWQQHREQW